MEDNTPSNSFSKSLRENARTWNFWKPIVFVTVGATGGFLYYHYVGCTSGACGITSNPWMSSIWGGVMGLFFAKSPCLNGKC